MRASRGGAVSRRGCRITKSWPYHEGAGIARGVRRTTTGMPYNEDCAEPREISRTTREVSYHGKQIAEWTPGAPQEAPGAPHEGPSGAQEPSRGLQVEITFQKVCHDRCGPDVQKPLCTKLLKWWRRNSCLRALVHHARSSTWRASQIGAVPRIGVPYNEDFIAQRGRGQTARDWGQ